ncbi:MAG: hypothetical protein AAF961_19915, partial [Planctomycetota bacterium]
MTRTTDSSVLAALYTSAALPRLALLASVLISCAVGRSYGIAPLQVDAIAQFGAPGFDEGFGVSATEGGAFVVGSLAETGTVANSPRDAYIAKYNDSAELVWSRALGKPNDVDRFYGVATGPSGNAVAVGRVGPLASDVSIDAIIASYSGDGDELWRNHFDLGLGASESFRDVVVAPSGDSFAVGTVNYVADAGRPSEAFVTRFDPSGSVLWSELFGDPV